MNRTLKLEVYVRAFLSLLILSQGFIDMDPVVRELRVDSPMQPVSRPGDELPISALLNLDEIEERGSHRLTRKAWAYYWSAADDLYTKQLNSTTYNQIFLRPRIFINVEHCDLSTTFLGFKIGLPILISPAAEAGLAHPEAEHGIATACSKFSAMQIISFNASMTPEQIVHDAIPNQIFGWQLYVRTDIEDSNMMLRRINELDAIKFVVLTLDSPVPGKREEDERMKRTSCYSSTSSAAAQTINDLSTKLPRESKESRSTLKIVSPSRTAPTPTCEKTLPWLVAQTKKPIILKGLQTYEDAYLAYKHPLVKGIILSNHGGRQADTAPPAIHTLLEIRKYCPQILHQPDFEILIDGGVRRETNIVKALALGAKAVGLGRAPLFGLAAAGPEGVEKTLEILKDETLRAASLLGVQRMNQLNERHVNPTAVERAIFDGPATLELDARGSASSAENSFVMVDA